MKKGTREMTKLDKLVATCELLNDRDYGTPETFRDAIYKLGHEAFVKALQGKLYEIKYDGNLSKVGKDK